MVTTDDVSELRVHPSVLIVKKGSPSRVWCNVLDRLAQNVRPDITWYFPNGSIVWNTGLHGSNRYDVARHIYISDACGASHTFSE